jgi:hypothetical protein
VTPCATCLREILGTSADPKTCVHDRAEGPLVLCGECFETDGRRSDWVRWDESVHGLEAHPFLCDEDPLESAAVCS